MSILIGEDIAPTFAAARRELVLAGVPAVMKPSDRSGELLFSRVGSIKEPLVEVVKLRLMLVVS
jgi:hypothetical protein